MEKNLFQQAKEAMNEFFTNRNEGLKSEKDKEAAQKAIQAAYETATPEEAKQLEQLEHQINQLK